MKRIKIIFAVFLAFLLSVAVSNAQEKRIKVIIEDNSGKKVVIDTVFSSDKSIDSIRLKDGGIVYLGRHHRDPEASAHGHGHRVFITDDDGDINDEISEIYEMNSDSAEITGHKDSTGKDVYIYSYPGDKGVKVEKSVRVINENQTSGNDEKTKYVIAKNGIVVSIEGNDEAKIQELVTEIKKKLDISNDEQSSNPAVKESVTKIVRKK
jgi:hypothetical protein